MNEPELLTEREVAAKLRISTAALHKWRRERRGPAWVKLERAVRYPVSDLQAFINRNKKAAVLPAAEMGVRNGHAASRS